MKVAGIDDKVKLRKLDDNDIKNCRHMKQHHNYETYKLLLWQLFHETTEIEEW